MTRVLHRQHLRKPDGRNLWLYADHPIDGSIIAVSPPGTSGEAPNPHLRYHPLRGEWVAYAAHRQERTFLPPADYNPLAPTRPGAEPTELPGGEYDVAVFENRFPTFARLAHDPPSVPAGSLPARGGCEVVVYTQDATTSLAALAVEHVELLVEVWADRTRELGARGDVAYVMPFENRGVEVGATLHHPHGQIYAYPFVPPIAQRELAMQLAHWEHHSRNLLEDMVRDELRDGRRVLRDADEALSFVPVCARYAYETWVAPKRAVPTFVELSAAERRDFAICLKDALLRLDALWNARMPYVMVFHQAPTDGTPHPEAHLHAQIYPALRMPGRLKYLAGSELGAGAFTADTLPEEKAAELRAALGSTA
jgi:UDPglucose--hexose-1-phosphate uridylyltransferase